MPDCRAPSPELGCAMVRKQTLAVLVLLAISCAQGAEIANDERRPDAGEPLPDSAVPDGAPLRDSSTPDTRALDSATPDGAAPDATPDAAPDGPAPDSGATRTVVFTGADPTSQLGSVFGGSPFDDTCPAGQALIGFGGSLTNASGYHSQLSAQCGKVERLGTAGSYVIRVSPGASLPVRGLLSGTSPWTRACPQDQVITGFVGRSGTLVDQLTFRCSPLLVDPTNGTALALGTATALAPIGGNGGQPFAQTDCATGKVATVARLRAGDGIDAFGLACSAPSVAP